MNFFDFSDEVERVAEEAKDESSRLRARTEVGRKRFPGAVEKAGFSLLRAGADFNPNAYQQAIVIGVATWSDPDLAVLGTLVEHSIAGRFSVFIFDIDDWTLEAIILTFPGTSRFLSTPVVAQYRYGSLVFFGEGPDAVRCLVHI